MMINSRQVGNTPIAMKTIYSGYFDRLYELNRKNKCVFMSDLPKKDFFDVGTIEGILDFLQGKKESFSFAEKLDAEKRYYVGYPYFHRNKGNAEIFAPLLFYPIKKEDEETVISDGRPLLNRALFLQLGPSKKKGKLLKKTESEGALFPEKLFDYMIECGYNFTVKKSGKNVPFFLPKTAKKATVYPIAVLGKFDILSPIQEEYCIMQKNNLSNSALEELLEGKVKKKKTNAEKIFFTEVLDPSQEKAVERSESNVVVDGPPGTGKSQTISAVIGNEACHGRCSLVVSQKKTALDVIRARLRWFYGDIPIILSENNEKEDFFRLLKKADTASKKIGNVDINKIKNIEKSIKKLTEKITDADELLHRKTSFGLTLQEMYEQSFAHPSDEEEKKLISDFSASELNDCNHDRLTNAINVIKNSKLTEKYIEYTGIVGENPLAKYTLDADVETLNKVRCAFLAKQAPFPYEKYPFSDLVIPFFTDEKATFRALIAILMKTEHKRLTAAYKACLFPAFWVVYPFIRHKYKIKRAGTISAVETCLKAYKEYVKPYLVLKKFVDKDGYRYILRSILSGNENAREEVEKAIGNYLKIRELKNCFSDLSPTVKTILAFSFEHGGNTPESMLSVLNKIIPLRIYHELIKTEQHSTLPLFSLGELEDLRKNLKKLKKERTEETQKFANAAMAENYRDYCRAHPEKYKNFIFRINDRTWSIEKTVSVFYDFLLRLFPCVLVSPSAACFFPLKKDLFGKVIFDEAGQLPIENVVPSLYRGMTAIVAGDDKQLSPAMTFSSRIADEEKCEDLSSQDAMDARSLLDLASAKYETVGLTYHYRSRYSELIDFSNAVFYHKKLCVAPDPIIPSPPPIEWIKVNGKRIDRKNIRECAAVLKTVEENVDVGTVGIITFNVEQMELIQNALERKKLKNNDFAKKWNGFVRNIENIQGEEADVIVFSVGFAPDAHNRLYARYGLLANNGGENRLNVAITRARKKIYVISSVEPEQLPVGSVKNPGPKLLKDYLFYAKSVSTRNKTPFRIDSFPGDLSKTERELIARLSQIGYFVAPCVGTSGYRLSMAIWDEKQKRYLLGLECDARSYESGGTTEEREIGRPDFLEQKGWNVLRVWARDWWLSPQKVLSDICAEIEKQREKNPPSLILPASLPASGKTVQDVAFEIGEK